MPPRRSRQNEKNFGVYMKSKEERVLTAACGSAVRHASRKRKQRHEEARSPLSVCSGGSAVCESASRDRKAHGKIFVKKQENEQ